jgi:hypothetical protein
VLLVSVLLGAPTHAVAQQNGANGAAGGAGGPGESADSAPPAIPVPLEPAPLPPAPPVVPAQPEQGLSGETPGPPLPSIPSVPLPVVAPGPGPDVAPAAILDLQTGLTLAEEYSDNFNLSSTDGQSNFRTSIIPGATLAINGARTKGLVGYNLSIHYDTLDSEIGYFNTLLGQVQYRATPLLTLTAYDTLVQGDQPEEASRLGLRRERSRFTSNVFSLNADYVLPRVALRAGYVLSTFFDETEDTTITQTVGTGASTTLRGTSVALGYEYLRSDTTDLDIDGHRLTASTSRRLTAETVGGVSATYAFRNEQGETLGDPNQDDSFSLWSLVLFASYDLPPRLNVAGSIGYGQARSETGDPVPEIPATLTLTYRFARAVATLGVESGFSETFDLGENFGVVRTLGVNGSLTYPLTARLSGTATAFYRKNAPTELGTDVATEDNDLWGGTLSLSAQLRSWLILRLEYHYSSWNSPSGDGYTENRARATLTATF